MEKNVFQEEAKYAEHWNGTELKRKIFLSVHQFVSEVSALGFQLSFKRLQERRKGSTNSCILKIEKAENILDST